MHAILHVQRRVCSIQDPYSCEKAFQAAREHIEAMLAWLKDAGWLRDDVLHE